MKKKTLKILGGERFRQNISDLIFCFDVFKVGDTLIDKIAKIVIFEKHMTDPVRIYRVFLLCDACGVVFVNDR